MILPAILTVAGLGLVLGIGLVLAGKYLAVEIDPRIEQVSEELPNANCGACGYAGCTGFAAAVVAGEVAVTDCTPGGKETAERIAEILGVEAGEVADEIAIVLCAGGNDTATRKSEYFGVADCRAAELIGGGDKLCTFGCLGLGSCLEACPFGAVIITKDRLAIIDPEKCTGCGKCVEACPRNIIKMTPRSRELHVLCSSKDKGKVVKGYCTVGCTACKLCTRESKIFNTKTGLSVIDEKFDKEVPETASLVCATQTILDLRKFDLIPFITDKKLREEFKTAQADYKAEQKKIKAAKKAKKAAAKKAAAEKKAKAEAEAAEKEAGEGDEGEAKAAPAPKAEKADDKSEAGGEQ